MAQAEITGLFQWLGFGTSSVDTYTGVVTGGELQLDPDPRQRKGIGGQIMRRGGLVVPRGSAEFMLTYTNYELFTAGLRATYPRGALTELEIEGGADQWSMAYSDAIITEWGLDYAQGDGLKASVSWGALEATEEAGGSQDLETNLDFEDYEFVVTFGDAEYGVASFSLTGNNNVSFHTNGDTKSAGELRLPQFYLVGDEDVTLQLDTGRPIPNATLGLLADELVGNFAVVATGDNGSEQVVLTMSNLMPQGLGHGFVDGNSQALWRYNFIGHCGTGTLDFAIGTGY